MKKILIITYYWPPSGGAAVQRWLSFANHLARAGYGVHLLTVDPSVATFQLRDESLLAHVHPAIQVHTTRTREPFGAFSFLFGKKSLPKPAFANEGKGTLKQKIARFIRGNFFVPDPRKGWKPYAVKEASRLIEAEGINQVITAGPPHSTHLIGEALKAHYGLRWIADFHDLWTDIIYYDLLYHLPFVKRLDRKLERRVLEGADLILTVGEKYKAKLLEKSDRLTAAKIEVLRIGYDAHLFAGPGVTDAQDAFTLTYTGTMASYYQPEAFVDAFAKVVKEFSRVPFRLRFAGVLPPELKARLTQNGLGAVLDDRGYVSHEEAVELMRRSTVLLLVNPVTKDEAMVIPGKLYEYLAARKPIINLTLPTAESAMLISDCGAGKTFGRNEQAALEDYLRWLVMKWQEKKNLDIANNQSCVAAYSRTAIGEQLVTILNQEANVDLHP